MSLMYMQMGMSALGAVSNYSAASHESKMQKISRDYQKAVSDISFRMQSNAITENDIEQRDAVTRASAALQITSLQDKASAEAGAAAAGVRGGSIDTTLRGIMRSGLQAKHAMRKKIEAISKATARERSNLRFSKVAGTDVSPIGKPSVASSLLGLGASMLDIWDSHQPEGKKITDRMARGE